jgi:predicted DNA binding CopG/RHH family protein
MNMRKEYDFTKLKRAEPKYLKHLKESVTIRLDPHVIEYFKKLANESGLPYQSLINYVLKDYAKQGLEPSANWPSPRKGKRVG